MPTITKSDLASLHIYGYALLRNFEKGASSLQVAEHLGAVDVVEGLNVVQTLEPRTIASSLPNTYSGNFGCAEFPLHTDLAHWARPPRYILLRCVRGKAQVATRILDGRCLIERFGSDGLTATLVQPRRPTRTGKQLLRLFGWSDDSSCALRWDSIYLHPASRVSAQMFGEVLQFLAETRSPEVNLAEEADTMVIDNWRCLHGRSPVGDEDKTRLLERVYLKEVR